MKMPGCRASCACKLVVALFMAPMMMKSGSLFMLRRTPAHPCGSPISEGPEYTAPRDAEETEENHGRRGGGAEGARMRLGTTERERWQRGARQRERDRQARVQDVLAHDPDTVTPEGVLDVEVGGQR